MEMVPKCNLIFYDSIDIFFTLNQNEGKFDIELLNPTTCWLWKTQWWFSWPHWPQQLQWPPKPFFLKNLLYLDHGLRTPREELAFTARPKIHSHYQIFRYGGSIFCLPHRPIFSDIFDLCLHWVSVVRGFDVYKGNVKTIRKTANFCGLLRKAKLYQNWGV